MFKKTQREKKTPLDKAIEELHNELSVMSGDSEEYARMVDQLVKLYKLKEMQTPKRVSPDTWAIVGANLAGIVLILSYERANIIASKALSFVMKLR